MMEQSSSSVSVSGNKASVLTDRIGPAWPLTELPKRFGAEFDECARQDSHAHEV